MRYTQSTKMNTTATVSRKSEPSNWKSTQYARLPGLGAWETASCERNRKGHELQGEGGGGEVEHNLTI